MTYAELLPLLRERRHLLVTGPQRSGSTIAAEILAADLDLPCVREEAFRISDVAGWWRLLLAGEPGVVQCPTMSSMVHYAPGDWAVAWMVRPLDEILASERRIFWNGERAELDRYFCPLEQSAARLKLGVWKHFQRDILGDRAFELDYHSLAGHALWVPPERRMDFGPRQTREGQP